MRILWRGRMAFVLVSCTILALASCGELATTLGLDTPGSPGFDVPWGNTTTDTSADAGDTIEWGDTPGRTDLELIFDVTTMPDQLRPGCLPGEGCFLDKCAENSDCESGWCVDHMGESVCSMNCQEECPAGWSCQQVADGGPDLVFVCVSNHTNLCRPCATGNDCKSEVGKEDVCVDYGAEGSFCGGACSNGKECPWGFTCKAALTTDGIETEQCMSDAGVCPCTGKSVELALWTPCEIGNELGVCTGKRICTADGLTDCDAALPATETCNGEDDDCNGLTDEALEVEGKFVGPCEDDNGCTDDSCLGEEGCVNEPLTGTECMDGDICTTADHCDEGVCVGSPVNCDDEDPCTDDFCAELGGCDHIPNAAPCDDEDPCTIGDQCSQGECEGLGINCDCSDDADCAALEDGDLCNGTLYCDQTELPYECAVKEETVIECPEPQGWESICIEAVCEPTTGQCFEQPDHEDFACSTQDKCIVGETCQQGECIGGFALNCNDGNTCTQDSCDSNSGCIHEPVPGPCSDGTICTSGDQCEDGSCLPGPALDCDDQNPCTVDSCEPEAGCVHKLTIAPGSFCCETAADCPPDFTVEANCDSQPTCQGSRGDAVCVANQCGLTVVQDDSACVGLSNECGLNEDILCTGEADQLVKTCVAFCLDDADCDPIAYCDGTCKQKKVIGELCTGDNQCDTGNCNPSPGGTQHFCNAPMHDCAMDDGTGVMAGFNYCFQNDLWNCGGADIWLKEDCADDCGFYLPVDGCQAAKCATCPGSCTGNEECDANAHCDGECQGDQDLASPCDENSDCISGVCAASPSGADFCIPLTDDCALDDGSSADAGYSICVAGDSWSCEGPGQWSQTDCHDECGFYTSVDSCGNGSCGPCPKACIENAECDLEAHCDATCVADLPNGAGCDEDSDCVFGHCQNGFCCDDGDCCNIAGDCPGGYSAGAACEDQATCQGHRTDASCNGSVCGSVLVVDDSGCTADLEANDCGLYPASFCTGNADQQPPACAESCQDDEDCDDGAHCDDNACVADQDYGSDCDENSDCAGELCHNDKCCKEACDTQGCLTGMCGDDGECTWHTSGQQNCGACHACDGNGQCQPQSVEGAAATALSCASGDEGCRYCNAGSCTHYVAGQHGCPADHQCNANGQCEQNAPQYQIVCWDAYPGSLGSSVGSHCPAGYVHDYHTCGGSANIGDYQYGPYYEDKMILHNGSGDHCWCCCNCNMICVRCKK